MNQITINIFIKCGITGPDYGIRGHEPNTFKDQKNQPHWLMLAHMGVAERARGLDGNNYGVLTFQRFDNCVFLETHGTDNIRSKSTAELCRAVRLKRGSNEDDDTFEFLMTLTPSSKCVCIYVYVLLAYITNTYKTTSRRSQFVPSSIFTHPLTALYLRPLHFPSNISNPLVHFPTRPPTFTPGPAIPIFEWGLEKDPYMIFL
ncbi:hypothetical protein ACTXT7_006650 [Hymenolepis weldensis]